MERCTTNTNAAKEPTESSGAHHSREKSLTVVCSLNLSAVLVVPLEETE